MRILGISRVGEDRRIYVPKAVRDEVGQSITAYVRNNRVVICRSKSGTADDRGRIPMNDKILEYLKVGPSDMVIFLEEDGTVYLAKAEMVDARIKE